VSTFPPELRAEIKSFRRFVAEKNVFTIRSKFVAHNFDAFSSYTYEDGDRLLSNLLGSTLGENITFFEFINPSDHRNAQGTVSHFVTALRDHVKTLVSLPPRIVKKQH
jgi:hypothetical protein